MGSRGRDDVLMRQKVVLSLLAYLKKPVSPTVLVKLIFLLRHETKLKRAPSFYDFVPDKYGPFSFVLHRELLKLKRDGYLCGDERSIALSEQVIDSVEEKISELPAAVRAAVRDVVGRYGSKGQTRLVRDVYEGYPWYASKSMLRGFWPRTSPNVEKASLAVYTAGYEGRSVDAFFDDLMRNGIQLVIDVRANPVSRRYGFCKRRFGEIAGRLGLGYRNMPSLGVPSEYRSALTGVDSRERLLDMYEQEVLPQRQTEIIEVAESMKRTAAVLVCMEKNPRCCHRSRLAEAVFRKTLLEVKEI